MIEESNRWSGNEIGKTGIRFGINQYISIDHSSISSRIRNRIGYHINAYLELLGRTFTGADARALHLGQDKALAKKILRYHGIPTADFVTVPRGKSRIEHAPPFPLIVKPSREDGSIGIDTGSVVHDNKALRGRVRYIHDTFSGPALVERYIDGREIYAAVIGNDPPEALPLVELDLSHVPEGVPRIAGAEVKWWRGSEIYGQTPPIYPKKLPRALTRRIQNVALEAYRVLGLRDYGRVDLRVTERGEVFVLEVNPNPCCLNAFQIPRFFPPVASHRTETD